MYLPLLLAYIVATPCYNIFVRLRKTKLAKKVCVKCRLEYASFHHSTKYCQSCYDLVYGDIKALRYLNKQLKWVERLNDVYKSEIPEICLDHDYVKDHIEKHGSIDAIIGNEDNIIERRPEPVKTEDIDEFDKDYYELLKRLDKLPNKY